MNKYVVLFCGMLSLAVSIQAMAFNITSARVIPTDTRDVENSCNGGKCFAACYYDDDALQSVCFEFTCAPANQTDPLGGEGWDCTPTN